MNLIQKLTLLVAVLAGISAFSCSEDILLPDLKGSLVGYAYTFDEYADLLEDHSGVLVSALGLSETFKTHTNAQGRFEFKDLPAGTYELHVEKQGFGTLKQFGIKHLGGKPTTLYLDFSGSSNSVACFIYEMPTTQIVNLSIENDTLTGTFAFSGEQPESLDLLIYLSDEPDFVTQNATFRAERTLWNTNGKFQYPFFYGTILPFQPGENVYFRARICNREEIIVDFNRYILGISSYFDIESNLTVYPNAGNESAQFSFIYPE